MPRHWRCTNGHTWTGDLGALTFCPECGSADVYEVRAPGSPAAEDRPGRSDQTLIQAPPLAADQATFVQSPPAAAKKSAASDQTFVQPPPAAKGSDQTWVHHAPVRSSDATLAQPPLNVSDQTLAQMPLNLSDQTLAQSPLNLSDQTLAQSPLNLSDQTLAQPPLNLSDQTLAQSLRDLSGATLTQTPLDLSGQTLAQPPLNAAKTTLIQPIDGSDQTFVQPAAGQSSTSSTADIGIVVPTDDDTADYTSPAEQGTLFLDGSPAPARPKQDTFEYTPIDETAEGTVEVPDTADRTAVVPDDPNRTAEFASAATDSTVDLPADDPSRTADMSRPGSQETIQQDGPSASERATVPAGARQAKRPVPTKGLSPKGLPIVEGYEIVGILGRGGMGVVYKARQLGLNRLVALKMIVAGAHASSSDRNRFKVEAEAVAALQHPNIVQVYETGERDGLPFFSLEFLDGGSLQEKVKGQPLPARVAAECVERLAMAMQYAHDHGIVHRDLKPANILLGRSGERSASNVALPKTAQKTTRTLASAVTLADGAFIPKITDFGLAKRLEQESGITGTGAILGTPSYMSPEQALGMTHAIGPPADIYALGAILYDLLTGRPPFLGTDPMDTILKVRSVDPIPPSRLQPKVPRDVETVCLKCLEKTPGKRYATSGDLAADLRRFLDGQPVQARPTPAWEKTYKWTRRNPAPATVIGLIGLLIAGAITTGFALASMEHNKKVAIAAEKEEVERQQKIAVVQRDRAQKNFLAARNAVDELLAQVGDVKFRNEPRLERLRLELLSKSLVFYDRFLLDKRDDPGVQQEAGWAYQRVGRVREMLGQRTAAVTNYRDAIGIFGQLVEDHKDQPDYLADLAATHRLLAIVLEADRQPTAAEQAYRDATAALDKLAEIAPTHPEYSMQRGELLNTRAIQLKERGKLDGAAGALRLAAGAFEETTKMKPDDASPRVEWAKVETNLSTILMGLNQPKEATEQARAAVNRLTPVVKAEPKSTEYVKELARAYSNLGGILARSGQVEEAETVYREAIQSLDRLSQDFREIHDYRFALALAHNNLALLLKETRNLRAAEPEREKARALLATLHKQHPTITDYTYQYALSLDEQAIYLSANDRLAEATTTMREAVKLLQLLVDDDPNDPNLKYQLARRHLNLGILLARARNFDDADPEYAHAARLLGEAAKGVGPSAPVLTDLATTHTNRALLMRDTGKPKEEETRWREVADAQSALVGLQKNNPDAHAALARTKGTLAMMQAEEPVKAILLLREAMRDQREAVGLAPRRADLVAGLGAYGGAVVEALMNTGDHAGAAKEATDLGRILPDDWPGWPRVAGFIARCIRLAREDTKLAIDDRERQALAYGAQALGILNRAVAAGYKDAAALRASSDLEALRGEDFKTEFEKVLVEAEKNQKKP